jgi:hypothetical protein
MTGEAQLLHGEWNLDAQLSRSRGTFGSCHWKGSWVGTLQHLERGSRRFGRPLRQRFQRSESASNRNTAVGRTSFGRACNAMSLPGQNGTTGRILAHSDRGCFLGTAKRRPRKSFKQFEVWSRRKDLASVIDREDLPPPYINYATPFVRSLEEASSGRRSLFSDRGYMICVLLGGRTPFVLRPREDRYELIGPCYVHGIMDGEAMEQLRLRNLEHEDFRLP